MKKNGSKRNGRTLRRGNGTGSLWRKPGGNVWYMLFAERDPATGKAKRVYKSTGTADRAEAQRILDETATKYGYGANYSHAEHLAKLREAAGDVEARIEQQRAALQREAEERAAAERKAAEERAAQERDRNALTFAEAWIIYADSKKRPDSGDRTLAGYEQQYNTFAAWVKARYPKVTRLRDFSPDMAEAFIDHLDSTRSRSTRNKYLVFLRTFWRVLRWHPDAQLAVDPWEGIRTVAATVDQVNHKDLTLDQLAAVAAVLNSTAPVPGYKIVNVFRYGDTDIRDELRALFAVGIFTGARLGDCATMKWADIDAVARTWNYEPRKTSRKYHRRVTCAIHPTLEAVLAALPTFTSRKGYALPTLAEIYLNREPSMVTQRVQAIFRAAGIDTTAPGENGTRTRIIVGFHSLRHFFNAWLNNHGVNHAVADYLTCHEQGKVSATYYHENRDAIRRAILALPTLPMLTGAQAAVDAPQAAAELAATTYQAEATDAPRGNLEALRNLLAKMSDTELREAADMIQAERDRRNA